MDGDLESTLKDFSLPLFGGRNAVLAGDSKSMVVDVSNESVCAEYFLRSRACAWMCIGPSSSIPGDPIRAFSASKIPKENDVGEPPRSCAGSFAKKELGKPLELKSASTLTIVKHCQYSKWNAKGNEGTLTEMPQTLSKVHATNNCHERGRKNEQIAGHRNTGEEGPGHEDISINVA